MRRFPPDAGRSGMAFAESTSTPAASAPPLINLGLLARDGDCTVERLRQAYGSQLFAGEPGISSEFDKRGLALPVEGREIGAGARRSIGGSGRLLRRREELGERFGERLGMGQGGGVAGAGDLLYPCVRDVVHHVLRAGDEEGLGG